MGVVLQIDGANILDTEFKLFLQALCMQMQRNFTVTKGLMYVHNESKN
jgi:hypothetical protein